MSVKQTLKRIIKQFDNDLTKSEIRKIEDARKVLKTINVYWSSEFSKLMRELGEDTNNPSKIYTLLMDGEFYKIATKNSCSVKLKNVSPDNFTELVKYLKENLMELSDVA